jgi:hypothetical protein
MDDEKRFLAWHMGPRQGRNSRSMKEFSCALTANTKCDILEGEVVAWQPVKYATSLN